MNNASVLQLSLGSLAQLAVERPLVLFLLVRMKADYYGEGGIGNQQQQSQFPISSHTPCIIGTEEQKSILLAKSPVTEYVTIWLL